MRCGTARRTLWQLGRPRVVTPGTEPAEAHVRQCPACQRFFTDQAQLSSLVRDGMPRLEAPVELRRRVFDTLADLRRTRARRMTMLSWAAAGLIALATAAAAMSLVGHRPDRNWGVQLMAFAEEHRRATQDVSVTSSSRADVRAWLDERLAFAAHVPAFPGAELDGARLCEIDGRRGAVVCYRVAGRPVSFYLLPPGEWDQALRPAEIVSAASRGNQLIAWQGGGLTHALVANLPESHLRELATHCLDLPGGPPSF